MKKLAFYCLFIFISDCFIFGQSENEFVFTVFNSENKTGLEIIGYRGNSETVVIPNYINGEPVISVNLGVFGRFGNRFNDDKNWVIEIPSGVENIIISWPDNTIYSINVSPDNNFYSSVDGILYNKERTTLIHCPRRKSGEIYVPVGVKSIKMEAFEFCRYITKINLPDGLTDIDSMAFQFCSGLRRINIPSSVKRLGPVFYGTNLDQDLIKEFTRRFGPIIFEPDGR